MKHLSEVIFACSYFITGVDLDAYFLFGVNQGLYIVGEGWEDAQEGKVID